MNARNRLNSRFTPPRRRFPATSAPVSGAWRRWRFAMRLSLAGCSAGRAFPGGRAVGCPPLVDGAALLAQREAANARLRERIARSGAGLGGRRLRPGGVERLAPGYRRTADR